MKREDIASLIVYVLMIALAFLVGFLVIKPLLTSEGFHVDMNVFVFVLIVIVLGILVNVLFLEIGHALGGLMGGYAVVSINVLGLALYRKEGRWRIGFRNYDGLTGETILAPKENRKCAPQAFVWLPLALYLIELIVGVVLYVIFGMKENMENSWLAVSAIIFVTIGSMITLYNFVPFKLDSMTDGYRLTLISRKVNVEAYNELMRVENLQREGKEVGEIRFFDEITDFTAEINLLSVYRLLEREDLDGAMALIEKMLVEPKKLRNATYRRLIAQKLYIMLLTQDLDQVRKYYDDNVADDVRRFISNDLSMESLRAYVLIAGLLDEAPSEVLYADSRKDKALKRTPKARLEIEKKLYAEALRKVREAHADWDLEGKETK